MNDVADYLVHTGAVPDLRENISVGAAHLSGIALHDAEVCPDGCGQVGLVDDEQVGLGDARAAFARNFVAAGHINPINGVIRQFAAEMGGQVVATSVRSDSRQRTSADSSNATSVNFRGKSDILDLRNRGQKLLMPRQGQSFLADSCVGQHGFDCPTTLWDSEACRFLLFDMQGRQATEKNAKHANNSKLFPRKP
jgi:hypothetical protein